MLKTNRLNCHLTEEISKHSDSDIKLKSVLNVKSEQHKNEHSVKNFSSNCVFPNVESVTTADDNQQYDEQ